MKLDEKKIVEYLKSHIGENTTTRRLAYDSKAIEEMNEDQFQEEMWEIDETIRRIAEENGFRLNEDHCKDQLMGMPWVFDFFIEIDDENKV